MTFQYYPANVKSNNPIGFVPLSEFIRATKCPKNNIIDVFDRIALAEKANNLKLKSELKQNYLYYFTPCVIVNGYRRYSNISKFTGLLVLDFDHIDNANDFKKFMFNEYSCIIAAWLSPSKRGVKFLISIPVVNSVDEFKEYYFGISIEMDIYDGFDGSGQNCVLPLFQSYDPDIINRDNYTTWDTKGIKLDNFTDAKVTPILNISPTEFHKNIIIKIINTGFGNIVDNGHPQLRALCVSIGGYVTSGYISEDEALQVINYNIENHSYLKKGIPGYKKTAIQMIRYGQSKPLYLDS